MALHPPGNEAQHPPKMTSPQHPNPKKNSPRSAWEDVIRSPGIDLIQFGLDGGPCLGHELVTAGVQNHVQSHGGRSNAQTSNGCGSSDMLPEREGKVGQGVVGVSLVILKLLEIGFKPFWV